MGRHLRDIRFTVRGLMLLIALAALLLAGGMAIRERLESMRRAQDPWWPTKQAVARAARRAALTRANERTESRLGGQPASVSP
ncbi:MAG: hypothetical protein ACLQGP_03495 [Isosphaeraceae bacterium]